MRRPLLLAAGTLTGLAGMLLTNTSTRAQLLGTSATASGSSGTGIRHTAGPTRTTGPSPHRTAVPPTHAPTTTSSRTAHPAATATTAPSTTTPSIRRVDGQPATIPYGVVQVRLVITGSTITGVQTLQLPNADAHSRGITQMAVPLLRQQVLSAQSAQINGVSGATYTSTGYARSVQSALDSIGGHP